MIRNFYLAFLSTYYTTWSLRCSRLTDMVDYIKERQLDAAEHSKLPEVFTNGKPVGLKHLIGHVLRTLLSHQRGE